MKRLFVVGCFMFNIFQLKSNPDHAEKTFIFNKYLANSSGCRPAGTQIQPLKNRKSALAIIAEDHKNVSFETQFKDQLMPRFRVAAANLWKQKKAQERKIWVKFCMSDEPSSNSLQEELSIGFRAQFKDLFKREYARVLGSQQVPLGFEKLTHFNTIDRFEALATKYGDASYAANLLVHSFSGGILSIVQWVHGQK